MEFTRRVYEDGKVTIPKELRDLHGITEGDFVRLAIVEVVRASEGLRAVEPRPPEPLPRPAAAPMPPANGTPPKTRRRKRA